MLLVIYDGETRCIAKAAIDSTVSSRFGSDVDFDSTTRTSSASKGRSVLHVGGRRPL